MTRISWRHVVTAGVAALAAAAPATAATGSKDGGSISLVAYSTPKEAYGQIISAFQKTKAGQGVGFQQSYAGSTEQVNSAIREQTQAVSQMIGATTELTNLSVELQSVVRRFRLGS